MEQSDEELMLEYQQGNQGMLEVIFLRYKKPIFNFSFRFLENRADAEDVTADIFMKLVSAKESYRLGAKFKTWLYTVARNACISKIRQRQNIFSLSFKNKEDENLEWDVPDPKMPADDIKKRELMLQIKKAVRRLPVSQKEVFILRQFHELSYQEIAGVTGHSLENVKVLIFRAREQLRKTLSSLLKEASL